MKLNTPIVTVLNPYTECVDLTQALSEALHIAPWTDTVRSTLEQFVFEPMTQDVIQDIQNALSVNLADTVMEMSFGDASFDYTNGAVNMDVTVTPFEAAEAVEITITAGI